MTMQRSAGGSPDIQFSIVSGSKETLLLDCIASIYKTMQESRYSWTLTVTCNSPGTGLAERLRAQFKRIQTIENEAPRGFATNHNRILASSSARFVWLLNDDLVILAGTIDRVTEYMEARGNERVAAVSPRLLNPDGSLQASTYSFPTMPQIMLAHSGLREHRLTDSILRIAAPVLRPGKGSSRYWNHDRTIEVDTFRGACVAIRMSAVQEVGLMIEVAQVGAEETEWHRRLHDRGWKVGVFAAASVIHCGSRTVGDSSSDLYPEYLKGALYYFKLNRGAAEFAIYCEALIAMFLTRLAWAQLKRDKKG